MNPSLSPHQPQGTSPEEANNLLLLDQTARLTIQLIESVAGSPLQFSQRQRLRRILTRLEATIMEVL